MSRPSSARLTHMARKRIGTQMLTSRASTGLAVLRGP